MVVEYISLFAELRNHKNSAVRHSERRLGLLIHSRETHLDPHACTAHALNCPALVQWALVVFEPDEPTSAHARARALACALLLGEMHLPLRRYLRSVLVLEIILLDIVNVEVVVPRDDLDEWFMSSRDGDRRLFDSVGERMRKGGPLGIGEREEGTDVGGLEVEDVESTHFSLVTDCCRGSVTLCFSTILLVFIISACDNQNTISYLQRRIALGKRVLEGTHLI
jgi:hypothetical protein